MKKKVLCIALVAILLVALFACAAKDTVSHTAGENVLSNGNFESRDADWKIVTSQSEQPNFKYTAAGGNSSSASRGHYVVTLTERDGGSYTHLQQTVRVQRNSVYCLSVDYKISTAVVVNDNGRGAYLELLGLEFVSDDATAVTNDWKTFTLYFDTASYDEVTVAVGLGDTEYKATAGSVSFDNVSLSLVDAAAVTKVGRTKYVQDGTVAVTDLSSGGRVNYRDSYRITKPDTVFMVLVVVLSAMLLVGAYFVLRRLSVEKEPVIQQGGVVKGSNFFQNPTVLLIISLVVAFAIRLILVTTTYGYGAYQNILMKNAAAMAENGLFSYYYDSTTYAPGTMYILYIMGLLAIPLKLTVATKGFAIFIKIPAIVADLLTVFFVFHSVGRQRSTMVAFVASLVAGLLPVFFMASSLWSVYTSVAVLFLVLAAMAIRERQVIKMTVFYGLSVLFMEEALLLLPLLLAYAVVLYIKNPALRIKLPLCATIAIVVGYLVTLPLAIHWYPAGHPFIVIEKYVAYFSNDTYFARNLFNIYGMCGVSADKVNVAGNVFSGIFAALSMLGAIGIYLKCRKRAELVLLCAWTLTSIYTLCVRMNLWVLMAAMVLLLVYAVSAQEKRLVWIFGAYSVITAVNACYVMYVGGNVKSGYNAAGVTIGSLDPVMIVFSVFAVLTFLAFTYVTLDVCFNRKKLIMPLSREDKEQGEN